uniref:Uncharacterized protein n=1 Tax=Clastoptera arizonana TaxID=38151 RepID=A0A1B6DSV1_9HEMI
MAENGLQQSLGGRKVPTIKLDVDKILQDRERRAKFQLSQEKLEAKQKQISEEEDIPLFTRSTSIINKESSLRTCLVIEEIFNDNEYGRYYYYDELARPAKSRISDFVCENYLPPSDTRILNSQSCEVQFKLMSTTPDQNTAKQAYKRMVQTDFKVNFIDIITIFLNWGASLESLGASFIDLQIPLKAHNNKQSGKVFKHNIYFVLKYISHCSVGWNPNDVASMVFILLVSGLDKKFNDSYLILLETTKELIDRLHDNNISQLLTSFEEPLKKRMCCNKFLRGLSLKEGGFFPPGFIGNKLKMLHI